MMTERASSRGNVEKGPIIQSSFPRSIASALSNSARSSSHVIAFKSNFELSSLPFAINVFLCTMIPANFGVPLRIPKWPRRSYIFRGIGRK